MLFNADRRTDGHGEPNIRFSQFCERAKEAEQYHYLAPAITLSGFEEELHNPACALTARVSQVLQE